LNRVHTNSSLSIANAIKEELVDAVMGLFNWATRRMIEDGNSGERRNNLSPADVETTRGEKSGPFGSETVPLSTATDEEWGWEDEDMRPNLELSGISGRDSEEKENDDLAMAIAMSLSETDNKATEKAIPSVVPQKSTVDKSSYTQQTTIVSKQKSISETPAQLPPSSIEDLLGQMGSTGGPVITRLGTKGKKKRININSEISTQRRQ